MNKQGRTQLALGVLLILLGAWFLLDRTMPAFHSFFDKYTEWPTNMLLIGGAVQGAIATGAEVGGQQQTDRRGA